MARKRYDLARCITKHKSQWNIQILISEIECKNNK